jgi:hypothetical protein
MMTDELVRDILDRFEARRRAREQWDSHWQELAELMHPRRADFTASTIAGAKRTQQQFDSVPMLAARGLASAVEGLLTPKSERWFGIRARHDALNETYEVKTWLEAAEDVLWRALYAPRARFIKAFAEAYLDLVTFGTAVVFIGERSDLTGLTFRTVHLKNAYVALNGDGEIDTLYLIEELNAPQALYRFGSREALGEKTREALDQKDREQTFPFLQAVMPRRDHRPGRVDARGMRFAAITIDVESEHLVKESGYHEFPFSVMRWDTAAGEDYGRSPAMLALPDAKTLMQMGKTLLEAGHKAVDPPWFAPSDSIASAPRTFPGGITYYDAEALQGSGISRPIFPAVSGANFPLGREMQKDLREQVWSAFFKNVLNLPVEGPQMTATEVIERKQEFVRTVGPTLGRLEPDGPAAVVERCFGILMRNRAFPPPPPILRRSSVRFEYASPLERVRKQIEATAALRSTELLAPFVQADPGALDHFDTDTIVRDIPEAVGVPRRWIRPREKVQQIRFRRAKETQAAAQAQSQAVAADQLAKVAGKLDPQTVQQLGGLLGAAGGQAAPTSPEQADLLKALLQGGGPGDGAPANGGGLPS